MAIRVQEHIPLRDLTTLKVGGTARYFCSASSVQELHEAVAFAKGKRLPIVMLGGGSNVLLADGELNAVVVKIAIEGIDWTNRTNRSDKSNRSDEILVVVGAGESWDALVAEAVKRGLWGIENLSGIPGTVGAAPIQNIGAYGTEIKDVLEWVEVFDGKTVKVRHLSNRECFFGYRDSIFKTPKGKGLIITRVALRLSKSGKPNLAYKDLQNYFASSYSPFPKGSTRPTFSEKVKRGRDLNPPSPTFQKKWGTPPLVKEELRPSLSAIRRAVLDVRSKKFPDLATHGTAGSFFKNPIVSQKQFDKLKKRYPDLPGFVLKVNSQKLMVKLPLAWILEHICALKGYRKGAVSLFERQPIVLVATSGATAEEIRKFSEDIVSRVKEKTGIAVEHEVIHIS